MVTRAARPASLLDRLLEFVVRSDEPLHPIHSLHPYPAKYIPQLPREVIAEHTNERHTILDPFCGSGTTLVEAALGGRKSIGVDSNPIACLISRAKTTPLQPEELLELHRIRSLVEARDASDLPPAGWTAVPNADHWFQPNMMRELAWLLKQVRTGRTENLRTFLACVFSSIVNSASNQDSETRYTAVDKQHPDGYALQRFVRKLEQATAMIAEWSKDKRVWRNVPRVLHLHTAELTPELIPNASVDLIVTSPPYPNSFDYYLYHKLRMAWLGYDPSVVQQAEIGSRYEHSSRKAPIEVFVAKMQPVMATLARVIKPSKLMYLFVGDSVLAGKSVDMRELYTGMAQAAGLGFVGEREYELQLVSRSFHDTRGAAGNGHGHRKMQRVLVFEGRKASTARVAEQRAVATPLPRRATQKLEGDIPDGAVVALASKDQDRHIHSLVPFPSKFIPDIPRWAIQQFATPGAVVLDPFAGSGTTAVEAMLAGCHGISVDVSPYAGLVTKAKTTRVEPQELQRAADRLQAVLQQPNRLPGALRPRFELDDFWFKTEHLAEFARIHRFIQEELPRKLHAFFRVVLGSTIRSFSYQDPGQIKVKRDPKKVAHGTPAPREVLLQRLAGAVARLAAFNQRVAPKTTSEVHVQAAAEWARSRERGPGIDLLVTSPPYINAMNYPMAMRYELLLLGLVSPEDLIDHQQDYIGTERVYSRDYSKLHQVPDDWSSAAYLNPRLEQIFSREPKRSFIAYDFFVRSRETFLSLVPLLNPGARIVLVAGTNTIRQVHIDTFDVLARLFEDLGARRERTFHYEIIKQVLKLTRHETAGVIPHDGVAVLHWKG